MNLGDKQFQWQSHHLPVATREVADKCVQIDPYFVEKLLESLSLALCVLNFLIVFA